MRLTQYWLEDLPALRSDVLRNTIKKRGNPKDSRVVTARKQEGGVFPPSDNNGREDRCIQMMEVVIKRKDGGWNGRYCLFCSNPRVGDTTQE